jgi:hypothetical protein
VEQRMETDKYFGSHELQARENVVKGSSDRSFGVVFAAFFSLLGALSVYKGTERWPIWFALAGIFAILAAIVPRALGPLNQLWIKFGVLMHMVVSPVILGLIFYACIVPVGFLMRLFKNDPLQRCFDPSTESYWINRDPPGPAPESFSNQF